MFQITQIWTKTFCPIFSRFWKHPIPYITLRGRKPFRACLPNKLSFCYWNYSRPETIRGNMVPMQTYWLDILRRIQRLTIIYQAQNPGNNTINICIIYFFENIHHNRYEDWQQWKWPRSFWKEESSESNWNPRQKSSKYWLRGGEVLEQEGWIALKRLKFNFLSAMYLQSHF